MSPRRVGERYVVDTGVVIARAVRAAAFYKRRSGGARAAAEPHREAWHFRSLEPTEDTTIASAKGLAVVTGASTGIGLELARCAAGDGYDLVIAADEPAIVNAARDLRAHGGDITEVQADLMTSEGIDRVCQAIRGLFCLKTVQLTRRGLATPVLFPDSVTESSAVRRMGGQLPCRFSRAGS